MADSALLAAGGNDAPLSYTVPGATAIQIKQVHVAYVDNGAGGDWLPMVRITSDSGHTMGQAVDQGVKVTAGSDASVSFFPGVKHAAATTGLVNDVAYYEWDGTSSGAIPGTRKFNLSLRSTSDSTVFDASGGFARVKVTGAIFGYAFIDWGTTETVTAGAITEYRFGLDFPAFPFYTVGGPWKTIPATPSVLVYDTEVSAEFYVDPATITLRPFVRSPAMAPGGDPVNIFVVLTRTRTAWAF